MFMPVYNQQTHAMQKPFFFGGSQVPVVLDLPSKSIHGAGTRENMSCNPVKFVPHLKGKPMLLQKKYT